MNEVFAIMAERFARPEFMREAIRFSHRDLLDPLAGGRDELTGLHANTQIPKAVGYAAVAAATEAAPFQHAAERFWTIVAERRSAVIGGNSVREHFHADDDFSAMIADREGPEFCNTFNMLKLTRRLLELEPRAEYLDYVERALFNHVLGSQHPEGGFVYFTPMRPRHYRVYSEIDHSFWCCVGTGMEAQARYGEWIFTRQQEGININLYIAAAVELVDLGGSLRLDAQMPFSEHIEVAFSLASATAFPLRLRVPVWAKRGLVDLRVNGEPCVVEAENGFVRIDRTWRDGDLVTFNIPMELRQEGLPDGSEWSAYIYGPTVLATRDGKFRLDGLRADEGRMSHIASGPLVAFDDLPIIAAGVPVRQIDHSLRFEATSTDGSPLYLEPFVNIHDEHYTVYFPVAGRDPDKRRAALRCDAEAVRRDERTIDSVALGEQQPESDHGFNALRSTQGRLRDRRWRRTSSAMSVVLNASTARALSIELWTGRTSSSLQVEVNDEVVAVERFDGGDQIVELHYPLPVAEGRVGDLQVKVTFSPGPNSAETPAIFAASVVT